MLQRCKAPFSVSETILWLALFGCGIMLATPRAANAQSSLDPLGSSQEPNPIATPTMNPGTAFLFGLEKKFATAVAEGGGPAFASFFDKDGMTLGNRTAPAIGQEAIAAQAKWSPQNYQLTWTPEGGQLAPAGDMGFTWGHYEGRTIPETGKPVVTSGRYMTVWKKESDGTWKVVLDSSNEAPPESICECKVDTKP